MHFCGKSVVKYFPEYYWVNSMIIFKLSSFFVCFKIFLHLLFF